MKTKPGKYSIDEYTLDNNFMTGKEIEEMYSTLKRHMFIKYGRYDEDVIQRTILRGLWKADMYNPKKASKIVWFQSILRFIYIQEVDPNYNKSVSNLRLDDPGESEEGMNWHEIIGAEEIDEAELEKIKLVERIRIILSSGNYPYLTLRSEAKSYDEISKKMKCDYNGIWKNLQIEKASLKEELAKTIPDIEQQLTGRSKFHYAIKKLPGSKYIKGDGSGGKYVKVDPVVNMELKKCLVCDNVFPSGKGNKKTCNKDCSELLRKKREKEHLQSRRAQKVARNRGEFNI